MVDRQAAIEADRQLGLRLREKYHYGRNPSLDLV